MMQDLPRELETFTDGCLVVVAAIVVFVRGFAIGYALGRVHGWY